MNKPREIILRLVADGKITVEEADELLDAIERGKEDFFTDLFGKEPARRAGQEAARARARARVSRPRGGLLANAVPSSIFPGRRQTGNGPGTTRTGSGPGRVRIGSGRGTSRRVQVRNPPSRCRTRLS